MLNYNREALKMMTVKELREVVKLEQFELPGAWKARKEELIEGIMINQELENSYQETNDLELIELLEQQHQEEQEVAALKTRTRRKNMNSLYVTLNNGSTLIFESNKEFAEYFNTKHETNFRNDIAWYLVRGRNKKAKQVFEIKEIF